MREWYQQLTNEHPEVNMASGRNTTDAIYRQQVRLCKGAGADDVGKSVEVNWDLSKAFDHVGRRGLVTAAKKLGYPVLLLLNSLHSYGWSRRFVLNKELSSVIKSHRGVAAGSPFAPYELMVAIFGIVSIVRSWETPGVGHSLSVHVDDIALVAWGNCGATVIGA